jgi:micrococcal nuclease
MLRLFLFAYLTSHMAGIYAGPLYDFKVLRVIDGDTVEIEADFLPPPLKPTLKLRILGVDTPEKKSRAKCTSESRLAEKASMFTQKTISEGLIKKIQIKSWDKYGGRVLGDVIVDGQSLKNLLLSKGLAKPYDGGKKVGWCGEEGQ